MLPSKGVTSCVESCKSPCSVECGWTVEKCQKKTSGNPFFKNILRPWPHPTSLLRIKMQKKRNREAQKSLPRGKIKQWFSVTSDADEPLSRLSKLNQRNQSRLHTTPVFQSALARQLIFAQYAFVALLNY